jgi:protein gp37
MTTKIEWVQNADGSQGKTWNPITGCSKISIGCKNCYAERMAKRIAGRYGYPSDDPFKVTLHYDRLRQPFDWKKPLMIFLCSMSDYFHEDVPEAYIFQILEVMRRCPQHTFQVLTKRSERMLQISERIKHWPENVWLGVTVETKENKDRIKNLRRIDAPVKFLSCEPLLGNLGSINFKGINWVIVGGESGPGARPMRVEWVKNIRDHCLDKSVPFFFKQWGGVNKKVRGRKLEGKEWNQIPNTRPSHSKFQPV